MMLDLFQDQIPLLRQWLGEEEIQAVAEVLRSGWICQGPKVMEFEQALAGWIGVKQGVATNACTSSLHLALHLSGVRAGDEVIVPSFTCMATANAIHHAGARPVFADIDPQTFNIDARSAEQAITTRTKALLVVHQIGLPADISAFQELAHRKNLAIVEDGACSLGATYRGRRVGALGSPTCFSFHPRKMITTGEGGLIATDDAELARKARVLRSTGASSSDLERHRAKGTLVQQYAEVGYNYRMTDLQAAIGLVQLRKLDAMVRERAAQAKHYDAQFRDVEEVETPYVPEGSTHAYSSYLVRLRDHCPVDRDDLLSLLASAGISCRVGIQPLHHEPFYREEWGQTVLPHTEEAARNTLFLPIFPGLRTDQQDQVVSAIKNAMVAAKRKSEVLV
jgi:dTDP-4-amino-4,6-dideoxygalactose transaminase